MLPTDWSWAKWEGTIAHLRPASGTVLGQRSSRRQRTATTTLQFPKSAASATPSSGILLPSIQMMFNGVPRLRSSAVQFLISHVKFGNECLPSASNTDHGSPTYCTRGRHLEYFTIAWNSLEGLGSGGRRRTRRLYQAPQISGEAYQTQEWMPDGYVKGLVS